MSEQEFTGYTDEQLLATAREHAFSGLLMVVALKGSHHLRGVIIGEFNRILENIDTWVGDNASPVTPEKLGEDVLDACAGEGWDTTLLFWDDNRYDEDTEEEIPSEIAANIARRLLARYEMKPRT